MIPPRVTVWLAPDVLAALASQKTTAHRIATGSGFWIERFGTSALLSLRPGIDPQPLAHALAEWSLASGWSPARIFTRQLVREPGGKDTPTLLSGDPAASPCEVVSESGLLYEVDFSVGYSPGLFPDQRANREFLRSRCPRRVLNTFAYTCAFSVAAAASGAQTLSVDSSKTALQRGRRNFALNALPTDGHRFHVEDVPTSLRRLAKRGETFDAILLDPPTFGRGGGKKTFRFERDFPDLLAAALALAAPGAAILLSTNDAAWDASRLVEVARPILPAATRFQTLPAQPDFSPQTAAASVWAILAVEAEELDQPDRSRSGD
jgi:23S rRNA (cytosine1962-C5)-methyltransferase